jgi:hypothetical protein
LSSSLVVNNTAKLLKKASESTVFVKTGRKTGCKTTEYLNRYSWDYELQTLWANAGRGQIEEFEYTSNGITTKVKGSFYSPEDLKDNRSWICRSCICHEKCSGYFYEVIGMDYDQSLNIRNLDLKSLRRRCQCRTCKHNLNLDLQK